MDETHARGGKEGCRHVGKIFAKGPERQMIHATENRKHLRYANPSFHSSSSPYESIFFFKNIGISKVTAS